MKINKLISILLLVTAAFIFNGCNWQNSFIDDWWVGPKAPTERTNEPVIPITVYTVKFDMAGGTYVDLRDPVQIPPAGPIPDQLVQAGFEAHEPGLVEHTMPERYFAGWWNTETNTRWTFTTKVTAAADPDGDGIINLQARWSATGITVTFDPNLPTATPPKTNADLTYVPLPEYVVPGIEISEPTGFGFKDNSYMFLGWYTAAANGTKWNFYTDKVETNLTLYARWAEVTITDPGKITPPGGDTPKQIYAIEFEDNLGSGDPYHGSIPTQYKLEDDSITKPNAIHKTGFVFEGWYTDETFTGDPWDFTKPVGDISSNDFDEFGRKKVKLYAKWGSITVYDYTVKFDMNGGQYVDLRTPSQIPPEGPIPNQIIKGGCEAAEPGLVINLIYPYFAGWYNTENNTRWIFNSTKVDDVADVNGDYEIELQARWSSTGITVTFNTNLPWGYDDTDTTYGRPPLPERVVPGIELQEPKDFGLKNSPYFFLGWYIDDNGDGILDETEITKWNFTTDKTGNTDFTLYARWGLTGEATVDGKTIYAINFTHNVPAAVYYPNQPIPTQYKLEGDTVSKPGAIDYPGYVFSGWYISRNLTGTAWDFANDTINSNTPITGTDSSGRKIVTLYAKWEPIPYTEPWYNKYYVRVTPNNMLYFPFQFNTGGSDYRNVSDTNDLIDNLYYEADIIYILSNRSELIARIIGYKDTAEDNNRLVTDREEKTWENLYGNGLNGIKPEQLVRDTKLPSGVSASNPTMIIGPNEEYSVKAAAPNDDEVRVIIYFPMY